MPKSYILTLSCPDRLGIVAEVSNFLANNNCNILDSAQFGDRHSQNFFLRIHFSCPQNDHNGADFLSLFSPLAENFNMNWNICDAKKKSRLLLMVSRFGHCLHDLLYRFNTGSILAEAVAIISNHMDMEHIAKAYNIPYYYLPVSAKNRKEQEAEISNLFTELEADSIILARYMQILSEDFATRYRGKIINIHHSFLPSFKGASPYSQAFARGVKLIGATAHYVTADLDEGPIIEQDVIRVDHALDPEDLAAVGRDVESLVLARAVKAHVERRILLNGQKTVVFR